MEEDLESIFERREKRPIRRNFAEARLLVGLRRIYVTHFLPFPTHTLLFLGIHCFLASFTLRHSSILAKTVKSKE